MADRKPNDAPGDPDQEICVCFHVSRRKIVNFIRIRQPKRPAQLSECFGAGTGCGWCRRYLTRLLEDWQNGSKSEWHIPDAEINLQMRDDYRKTLENNKADRASDT
jgi:bacterioferritin-associated ferredoxin